MNSDMEKIERIIDEHQGYLKSIGDGITEGLWDGIKEGVTEGSKKGMMSRAKVGKLIFARVLQLPLPRYVSFIEENANGQGGSQPARERDQVVQDRFDLLVLSCPVMDLEEAMHREKLFRLIADDLGPRTGRNPEEFLAMLQKREKLSSTVIRPGLAIPHLIVGGLESLELLLVRSGQGVQFTEGEPPVRVIFALAVPSGERNFYLKALVAIAEIAQNPEFDRRWLEAGSAEALREVVLAAERRREVGQTPPPGEERSGG